jgi:hypothetical protein
LNGRGLDAYTAGLRAVVSGFPGYRFHADLLEQITR